MTRAGYTSSRCGYDEAWYSPFEPPTLSKWSGLAFGRTNDDDTRDPSGAGRKREKKGVESVWREGGGNGDGEQCRGGSCISMRPLAVPWP